MNSSTDAVACALRPSDYHLAVAALGGEGFVIRNNAEIGPVLDQARRAAAAGKAVLVNVLLEKSGFRKGSISM